MLQTTVPRSYRSHEGSISIQAVSDEMEWPKDKLTRFEVARLIGARSLQIALGAPILLKTENLGNSIDISKDEFKIGMIPITIKRKLPTSTYQVIEVKKAIKNWMEEHKGEI